MKYIGKVVDRTLSPYVVTKNLGSNALYVEFPLFEETSYQKRRYYGERRIDVISCEDWVTNPDINKFPLT